MASKISLHIIRTFVLSLSFIFSCVILGISAFWIGTSEGIVFFDFQVLLLVTSLLTILLFPALFAVSLVRKNATFTMIKCELPIMIVMKVLWLSSMALLIQWSNVLFPLKCGVLIPEAQATCNQFFALEGLSIITWLLLLLYTLPLTSLSVVSSRNGVPVWHMTVREAQFSMTTNAAASLVSQGLQTVDSLQKSSSQQFESAQGSNDGTFANANAANGNGNGYYQNHNQNHNQTVQYSTTQYPPRNQVYSANVPEV